ncbi:hypothetical protein ACS0TY_034490 [Phlomoides rotata]
MFSGHHLRLWLTATLSLASSGAFQRRLMLHHKHQIAGAILKQRGDDTNSTIPLVARIIFDRGRRRSNRCPSTSLVDGRNRVFDRERGSQDSTMGTESSEIYTFRRYKAFWKVA